MSVKKTDIDTSYDKIWEERPVAPKGKKHKEKNPDPKDLIDKYDLEDSELT